MNDFYRKLISLIDEGRRLAVATIVESRGSTPQPQGGKMIVAEDGEIFFSIGGGALEAMVIEEAKSCIREGRKALKEYALHETGEHALGMACGGHARVFIEPMAPVDELVIFGAGHVGRALARLGAGLGFSLRVVDDRPDMLDASAFPPGARFHSTSRDFTDGLPTLSDRSYVVLVTRCHDTDEAALRAIGDAPTAYLGMIGSRRKVQVVFDRMKESGFPAGLLERVRAPIGISIGSHFPDEVAISILAEIVAVRNGVDPVEYGRR